MAQETETITYGKLTVFSDVSGVDIYVDAKFVGQDRATISNIPTGKHYVRVAKGNETIKSGIVSVQEGEETIIVAKPSEEELLAQRRKPNSVFFYGSMTGVGYSEKLATGTVNLNYKPQYGFGAEVQFPVPVFNFRIDLGFNQNYPSVISTSATQEANMAISTPYLNVSRNLFDLGGMKLNGGLGLNYGIFSPGYKTLITIASRLGYQAFIEANLGSGKSQAYMVRLGYVSFAGESAGNRDVTSSGYYLQAGAAYQL
ncbi:MAG: PEGA domain-containing protein [Candidatus Saganbacteria bacterium]|nr:PEGA domain-containing protein [Candidatus Saganbacteria bacterium]